MGTTDPAAALEELKRTGERKWVLRESILAGNWTSDAARKAVLLSNCRSKRAAGLPAAKVSDPVVALGTLCNGHKEELGTIGA
ncbi:hypothetical protein NDU88_007492 [Pleurodeles waltl]|uniref:Uncharacterized protein n=1 Tax=Pleurodeles waltl TaxID=8319 RepID=A0AAV7RR41_PLEWA|nr:hypothetical protein NDU88_007492 [Pleurodeles waltl]